jgi:hypothetical protein
VHRLLACCLVCLASLCGCGGAPPEVVDPGSAAPTTADATPTQDARGVATAFLDALAANDSQRVDSVSDGEIGWKVIPERFGVLQSYELRPGERTIDTDVLITASMSFEKADLVFALVVVKKDQKWLMANFRMIEVARATVAGRILEHKGKTVSVQAIAGWQPEVGAEGEVSRQLGDAIPLLGGGQLAVAQAKVTASRDDIVELEILEDKSRMTVDGKTVDHLASGGTVLLTWRLVVCTEQRSGSGAPYVCIE